MPHIPMHYQVVDANVAWRVVDDEAVLLHADSSAYFGLNRTGTLLWAELAEQPMTRDQVAAWARAGFPDAPDGVVGQIATFMDELEELGLIEGTESAVAAAPRTITDTTQGGKMPAWEAPTVERFGELEKLILSGE